ncbi:hypothetical protein ACWCXH_16160 [Kitasatospora sp. NPDC001660]
MSFCQATFEEMPGVAARPIAGNPLRYRHLLAWHQEGPLAQLGPSLVQDVTETYWTVRHGSGDVPSEAVQQWRSLDMGDRLTISDAIREFGFHGREVDVLLDHFPPAVERLGPGTRVQRP